MATTSTKCDFTKEHYEDCITTALDNGYKIGPVRDYEKLGDKYILLRHDVDFCIEYAYEMAMWDFDLDVNSTFYVMLQSTTYNAMSPNNQEIIRLIDAHGHEIGYHVDPRNPIALEYKMLEAITGEEIKTFSQHYSTLTPKPHYDFMIDAMDWERLGVKYISESSMNWREGCMCNFINEQKYDKLEILTHPLWWLTNSKNRWESIDKLYDNLVFNVKFEVDEYREIVKNYLSELRVISFNDEQQANQTITRNLQASEHIRL